MKISAVVFGLIGLVGAGWTAAEDEPLPLLPDDDEGALAPIDDAFEEDDIDLDLSEDDAAEPVIVRRGSPSGAITRQECS